MEKYRSLFIGGEWMEASNGAKAKVINPATEEVIAEIAMATPEDVAKAAEAAQKAFDDGWADTTPEERAGYLFKLADAIQANGAEIARLESINVGKPISLAEGEIDFIADTFRYFAGVSRNPEGKSTQEYISGAVSSIRREPLGVTVGICPWNFPLMMLAWKVAPALAAGNTSIIKPATLTPLTALYFAELAAEILPPGVLNVITGSGSAVGDALCTDPRVRLVSMTGSTETGRRIAELCAPTLKKVHLELGGKAPVIVFDDADIDALIEEIKGGSFANSGQDCGQPCRLIVQEGVYDQLVHGLDKAVQEIVIGDTTDPKVEMGPVISLERRDEIQGFVDRAVAAGAKVHCGGQKMEGKGAYYPATIITDVDQKSEIVQNEVFGPVLTVQKFSTEEEALEMANDVIYGLNSCVWTNDVKRALRMSRKMQYGSVGVNMCFAQCMEMPWGGYKQSGYGKDMSGYAYEDYTQIKHVGMTY